MIQGSLVDSVAKLDIKDLLKPEPSPPPTQPQQLHTYTRSISVPNSYSQCHPMASPSSNSTTSHYSVSTAPPYTYTQHQRQHSGHLSTQPVHLSDAMPAVFQQIPNFDSSADSATSNKRPFPPEEEPIRSRAKRLSKWSPAEDVKIIRLRGKGMKWDDIRKELPGRSTIACRLHYQNYLERRADWDEEKRNKLARVYDRLKADLWNPIAVELGVPWRAAENMHWALGEQEMARRANVRPFPVTAARVNSHEPGTSGRVAQRDRMLEATRVFEGRDLSALSTPFHGVNENGNGNVVGSATGAGGAYGGMLPAQHVHLAPIKGEQGSEYNEVEEEEEDGSDAEAGEGERARKRRSGTGPKLPGLAELDGEVQALAERERKGMGTVERFDGRRGSGGSSWSNGSTRSGGSRGSG